MFPPDELMVHRYLPAVRSMVAKELRHEGLSQAVIGGALGVTQASVSGYLSSESDRSLSLLSSLGLEREDAIGLAQSVANLIVEDKAAATKRLTSSWHQLLGSGAVCAEHRSMYPELSDCRVCMDEFGGEASGRRETLDEVSRATDMLESSTFFASVIPEVSVNLVAVVKGSDRPQDVAAIPGRIVKFKGRPKSTGSPEFGASGHMSKVLLAVRHRFRDVRAAVNMKLDDRMNRALHRLKVTTVLAYRDSSMAPEDPAVALTSAVRKMSGRSNALIDPGGQGTEPMVYLFGRTPEEVARAALRVAEAYVSV